MNLERVVLGVALAGLLISCSQRQSAPTASQQTVVCCQVNVPYNRFMTYGGLSDDISALMKAANTASVFSVKQLLEVEKVDVNRLDNNGQNALHHVSSYSIAGGEPYLKKIAVLLIENGINIDQQNRLGVSPLMAAIRQHNSKIAIELIKRGANVNLADEKAISPLMLAAYYGQIAVVDALLGAGANINAQDQQGRNTLHYLATRYLPRQYADSEKIVRILKTAGIDSAGTASDGRSAYQWAIENQLNKLALVIRTSPAQGSREEQIKRAIEHLELPFIASLTETNDGQQRLSSALAGWLPLQVQMNRYDGEQLDTKQAKMLQLIGPYMDINLRNSRGQTALHIASTNLQIESMRSLLKFNPDLSLIDHRGLTALDVAALSGEERVFNVFFQPTQLSLSFTLFKADILSRVAGLEGRGDYGPSQITDTLLRLGMDPNAINQKGQTALCLAVKFNKPRTARILLDHAADVDFADNQGLTPVMYAVKFGRLSMLRQLLRHDPDLTFRNNQGLSAIEMTKQVSSVGGQGVQEIMFSLLER
ncbi:ankyrin repeat domain-containing protein [Agarivorans sp. QJM3NY_25]|uniref:ankyrin repeat domain-containing protein n=1 Tax=Agarivorans sp. QJM3NY_25 TaxID=3421430 RepID=UPI003D7EC0FA